MAEPRATLEYIHLPLAGRIVESAMWLFMATGICMITVLPLGMDRRDPYPWAACSIAWLIAAALAGIGIVVFKRRRGMIVDRGQGCVILWKEFFGRRSERRIPLTAFSELRVRTFITTNRRGMRGRAYVLQFSGPREKVLLDDIAPMDHVRAAKDLASYLQLPVKVEDGSPGEQPASEILDWD